MAVKAVRDVEEISEMVNQLTRQPKVFKTRRNPFNIYNDEEFRNKYRFSKNGVLFLDQLFGSNIAVDKRGGGLSSVLQILIALRYWGRNQVQDDAADIHGLSQQSVTKICRRVALAILEKRVQYIKMPITLNEQLKCIQEFESIAGFKSVIGAIDCTHIKIPKIQGPRGQFYINRKGYSSLNVQVVCNSHLTINNIVARWRGSTHDSRIFNESLLKQHMEDGQFHGRLLGDSGYACTPYLFTPVLTPTTHKEERYNYAHARTRNTVERCFGVWKRRFLCLQTGFRTSLENTKMYIVALAVLHNIAIEIKEENFNGDDLDYTLTGPSIISLPQNTLRGAAVRAVFIEDNF